MTEQKLRGPLTTSTRLGGQVDGEPVGLDQHVVLSAPADSARCTAARSRARGSSMPDGLVT
ncbi:hypothetical protein BIV24_12215 [Streptomyces colonosanans]|uniref:Uncharacterized protein n=1 Tax=Streptomyces colonosanans TaxID=1428652 RepID=A0A1S2PI37_9ACTN|nr:hypothetical protein BIV24_12215 [Streptomyces colonosanans]